MTPTESTSRRAAPRPNRRHAREARSATRGPSLVVATLTIAALLGATPVVQATGAPAGVPVPSAPDATTPADATTTDTTSDTTTTTTPPAAPPPPATADTTPPTEPDANSTTEVPPTTTPPATVAPRPAGQNITAYPSQIAHILATIRYLESRGNYLAPPNKGRASGAYQFITSTWDNYAGYSDAYLAPPEIQDERAAVDVTRFLAQWNNDVSMIPVMWYYPRASRDLALMDIVPVPSAGNVLTVREYQQRWLAVWSSLSGRPVPRTLTLADQVARMGFAPELLPPVAVDPATPAAERTATVAFPVLGPTRLAAPDCGDAQDPNQDPAQIADGSGLRADIEAAGLCTEEAPGIIFGVKLQPVLAVVDGVVTDVHDEPGDPISVTITDPVGRSFELAGFNDDTPGTDDGNAPAHLRLTSLATIGRSVRAGQVLGFMGDTDPLPLGIRSDVPTDATVQIPMDAVAPHIRLTISDLDGTPVDAYGPVIDALFRQACSVGIGPWSGSETGVGLEPVVTETTDDSRDVDSEWEITSTGGVNASGWAAMIYPSENCGWAPPDKRGPGAGGPTSVPSVWWLPVELSTSIWIDLAVRDDATLTVPMMRP